MMVNFWKLEILIEKEKDLCYNTCLWSQRKFVYSSIKDYSHLNIYKLYKPKKIEWCEKITYFRREP